MTTLAMPRYQAPTPAEAFHAEQKARAEFKTLLNIKRHGTHTHNGVRRMVRLLRALLGIEAFSRIG